MNSYQITVPQVHCSGCKQLIKLSLQSEEFQNVTIDIDTKQVKLTSTLSKEAVLTRLKHIFETELAETDYRFENLLILS